ncbi:PRC-barrel domain-containing protein [Candidatus Parcubacteria bacterium]|nr:PRC-barrel domain-containing protein [Patescibacteria group bacterium]MCG2694083.1 PRC-barrel domain-containing protein [Candidatus Parcubacteria bacterium]
MILSLKKIIGLKVETKSGRHLGHLRDLDLDTETFEIVKIYVRPSGIVKGLVAGDLIISKSNVISISEEKIIVDDLAEKELTENIQGEKIATLESPASAMSTE